MVNGGLILVFCQRQNYPSRNRRGHDVRRTFCSVQTPAPRSANGGARGGFNRHPANGVFPRGASSNILGGVAFEPASERPARERNGRWLRADDTVFGRARVEP